MSRYYYYNVLCIIIVIITIILRISTFLEAIFAELLLQI